MPLFSHHVVLTIFLVLNVLFGCLCLAAGDWLLVLGG